MGISGIFPVQMASRAVDIIVDDCVLYRGVLVISLSCPGSTEVLGRFVDIVMNTFCSL